MIAAVVFAVLSLLAPAYLAPSKAVEAPLMNEPMNFTMNTHFMNMTMMLVPLDASVPMPPMNITVTSSFMNVTMVLPMTKSTVAEAPMNITMSTAHGNSFSVNPMNMTSLIMANVTKTHKVEKFMACPLKPLPIA
uniref:Uncharacterized protein n=1 Tax=Panagrolaimus sp. JU765 TaxID=591449 RepID=A0AC34QF09_9BILA